MMMMKMMDFSLTRTTIVRIWLVPKAAAQESQLERGEDHNYIHLILKMNRQAQLQRRGKRKKRRGMTVWKEPLQQEIMSHLMNLILRLTPAQRGG